VYVTVIVPPSYPVMVEPKAPAVPPDDADPATIKKYENDNANYLTEWKTYHNDKVKLVKDKKQLMGLIHRHMTEASEQRVISYEGGRVARDTKDPLAFLKVIVASHSTTGKADPEEALYEAQQGYLQTRMREEELLAPYTERFEGVVRTLTEAAQLADKVEQVPTPDQQARHYIKTLNSRFAQYKDAVQNGLVYYPTDVHEAAQGASEWSTTYTRKYDQGAGYHQRLNIFVSPRGRGGRGYGGRGRGYYGRGGRGNYYNDQNEPSKPEGASADSECYNCGATDHWAATCPKRGGRGGGRGRGGRGYLHSEGTQKMVETAVMEQAAGGGKSKN
jgi:Zinc knuckle